MRLFAAVWPPDEVLDHLDLALGALRRETGSGPVRWSARETWHLTCAFYGDLPDGRVATLEQRLAAVAGELAPYRLALRGAGVFAHRTLWVGVGGDVAAQQSVAHAAVAAGEAVGAPRDARPRERAHLTIGRVRNGAPRHGPGRGRSGPPRGRGEQSGFDPAHLVAALAVYEGPAWTVEALHLVASWPGQGRGGGPRYESVGRYPLGPVPGGVAPWAP